MVDRCRIKCNQSPLLFSISFHFFQKDVIAESEVILKLGLLFGEDNYASTEDMPSVLSFQHKLLQEYLAALYIAENAKLDSTSEFLTEAFPTWDTIESHREVVQFACGILGGSGAGIVIKHVARVLVIHTNDQLESGERPSVIHEYDFSQFSSLSLLASFQREGGVSDRNFPISKYPACRRPLAELFANTQLTYINNIDENDTLQLSPSSASIILELSSQNGVSTEQFDRLWHALCSIQANVTALYVHGIKSHCGQQA